MKKVIKYTGDKVFVFPNGRLATKDAMLEKCPTILTFGHYIITDANEEVCFAIYNASAIRGEYNIDANLSDEEAMAKIEEIINMPEPEPEVSAEERIASALEFQNMLALEDVE